MRPSVTRQRGRSVTPRRDTRRVARRGRAGRGLLGDLEEETPQEVEELEEHLLDSFESQPEPSSQADMVSVNGVDRDDLEPRKPWPSRLDVAELVELARRKRREVIIAYPQKPCKDGWMGPVPPEARDPEATLLHNVRWWFYPKGECRRSSTTERLTSEERPLWLSQAIACTSCNAITLWRRQSLD